MKHFIRWRAVTRLLRPGKTKTSKFVALALFWTIAFTPPAQAQSYSVVQLSPVAADSSIQSFSAGFGGIAGADKAPNDAGLFYGIGNYTQAGVRKLGAFGGISGALNLIVGSATGIVSILGFNDLGDALASSSDPTKPTEPAQYYFVSRTGTIQKLVPPTGVVLNGVTNDGRFLSLSSATAGSGFDPGTPTATFYSSDFGTQSIIAGNWSGYGRDGLLYSMLTKTVRFSDGVSATLPCNGAAAGALSKPASGRNCYVSATSSNGIVAGPFYSSDGRQGVFRFSKSGFEEVAIDSQFWGISLGLSSPAPTPVTGIANDGTVVLAPGYIDQIGQNCKGGPYSVRGAIVTDLKQFIPGNNCWNISAGISGGGRIYMSSQAQGLNLYLVPAAGDQTGAPNLVAGWNLMGNSSTGSIDVAATFGDASKIATVWKWIASSAKWAFFAPSLVGSALADYAASKGYDTLVTISGGEGFWVNAKQAGSMNLPSDGPISVAMLGPTLVKGWNLVSLGVTATPKQFCDAQSGGITTLWAWDATNPGWYFYAPSLDATNALGTYISSNAFRDFAANNKSLGPGVGFWVNRP